MRNVVIGIALVVSLVASCSVLDPSAGTTPVDTAPKGALEKTVIKVGILQLVDSAPMYLAIDAGYFKAEGLDVRITVNPKGSASIDQVIGGSIDIGQASYPPAYIPVAKGKARLKIVADDVQTRADLVLVVVGPGSSITDPRQLVGKKVAVSSSKGISELAFDSTLKTLGVNPDSVNFASFDITQMPSLLERGDVDAAIIAEPHLTMALQHGMRKLADPFKGPTVDFPWSGYFCSEKYAAANPHTVAAFQRALLKGVRDANANRSMVEGIVLSRILNSNDPDAVRTVQIMNMPVFPLTVDPKRLQRPADLLYDLGQTPTRLDVTQMLIPPLP